MIVFFRINTDAQQRDLWNKTVITNLKEILDLETHQCSINGVNIAHLSYSSVEFLNIFKLGTQGYICGSVGVNC